MMDKDEVKIPVGAMRCHCGHVLVVLVGLCQDDESPKGVSGPVILGCVNGHAFPISILWNYGPRPRRKKS